MIVVGEVAGRWVGEGARVPWTPVSTAVGSMRGGKLVAGILYDGYTGASIAIHARVTGPESVTRDWLFAIFDYPFNQLKVKRVTGIVSSANTRAIRGIQHLGLEYEVTLRDYFRDGDGLVYVMRKENCHWLRYSPAKKLLEVRS